ncbi:hypothetical protein ABTZ58_24925 [Streptomyces sp. NPDC094143]|uniref:hypothetical protein n=1 Tax=Streptomyces sp. NPDC094143 TaxID=3155310 RepID=UPI003319A400
MRVSRRSVPAAAAGAAATVTAAAPAVAAPAPVPTPRTLRAAADCAVEKLRTVARP